MIYYYFLKIDLAIKSGKFRKKLAIKIIDHQNFPMMQYHLNLILIKSKCDYKCT